MVLGTACYSGLSNFDAEEQPPGVLDDGAGDDDGDDGDDGSRAEPEAECRTAGTTAMRLLTQAEYENSVNTLLGTSLQLRAQLPGDEIVGEAYTHNGNARLDDGELRRYMQVAEDLAEAPELAALLPCTPGEDATSQRDCAEQLIVSLGRGAYRRPLSAVEIERWLAVYDHARADEAIEADFEVAIRTMIAGMLQSPFFLMVSELGEIREDTPAGMVSLTSHELAAKLSFLLWDTLPDEALAAAADDGSLVDPAVLEEHTRRMLEDPRARAGISQFFAQWLRSDAATSAVGLDPALGEAMARETTALIEDVLWGDSTSGTLDELLTADYSFVDADLAAHYGLTDQPPPGELARVSMPPERRGVLGHGSILAAYGEHSASVYRGLHVYRHFLCRDTMPPPEELDTGTFGELSPREAAEARIASETCSGCHGLFETVGLALEQFDASGRYRETYEDGQPVDAGGSWSGANAQSFDGLAGLSEALANNPEVQRCVAEQAAEFSFGLDAQHLPGGDDHCVADSIQDAFVSSGGDLRELLVNLVASDAFRLRALGPGDSTTCS